MIFCRIKQYFLILNKYSGANITDMADKPSDEPKFLDEYIELSNTIKKVSDEIEKDLTVDMSKMTPSEKCKMEISQLESKRAIFYEVFRKMENLLAVLRKDCEVYTAIKASKNLQQNVLEEMQKLGIIE